MKEKSILLRICFLFINSIFAAGCMCPHVEEKPPVYSLGDSWKNKAPKPTIATRQTASPDNWWKIFQDKNLNAIVLEGLEKSPTIEQAFARFEQAMFIAQATRADQFPQLFVNGYGDRRRIPKDLQTSASVPTGNLLTPTTTPAFPSPNTGVPPIVTPSIPVMKTVSTPTFVNDLIANLLVSYEVDFWGKYHLRTQAAIKRTEEAGADLETAQLLLVDQIAATYFTIQAMEHELALIRQEILTRDERINLLAKQCTHGLTSAFQLLDEQAALETRKTEEQSLIQSRDVNSSLLAVLVGREPNNSTFTITHADWTFPTVPVGLPSSLLANRPDIKTNLKEVEALIAEIGVAKTELLPSISLSAAAGYQAGTAPEWFKWKNRIWSIASSIGQPLFDAGQRFAEIDAAKARFREAASNLTQTVLSSVKEVEDALIAIRTQQERRTAALKREEDLASTEYLRAKLCTSGVQDYLIVLQTRENLFQAIRARINEEYNLQLGTLALMKGLGGSWGTHGQ